MKKRNVINKLKNSKQSPNRLSTKKLMIKLKSEKETKWKYQKIIAMKKKNERKKKSITTIKRDYTHLTVCLNVKSQVTTILKIKQAIIIYWKRKRKRFQGLWSNMKSICKNSNRWRKYRAEYNFKSCRWTSLRSRVSRESHSRQLGAIFRVNNWEQSHRWLGRMGSQLYLIIKQWARREQESQFHCRPEAGLERVQRRFHQAVKWLKSQRKWTSRRNKSLHILKYSIRNSSNPRS